MGATTTTLSPVLLQQIAGTVFDSVYKYRGVAALLPRRAGFVPGASPTFAVKIAGNASVEKFASTDPVPSAGYQQNLLISPTWQNYRVIVSITGDARRQAGGTWDGQSWPGVVGGVNFEFSGGLEDLVSYINLDMLSSGTHGINGQVNDDSVNFHDRSRGTYTTLKSAVVAGSNAALSVALLNNMLADTRGVSHGGNPKLLLMGDDASVGMANLVYGKLALAGAADVSGTAGGSLPMYSGLAPIVVPGMAANLLLAIDPTHFEVLNHEPENGGVDVLEFGPNGDSRSTQIVLSNAVIDYQPWKDGRLEAVTMGTL